MSPNVTYIGRSATNRLLGTGWPGGICGLPQPQGPYRPPDGDGVRAEAADTLMAAGAEVNLADPLGVKAFTYRRIKNDERDAVRRQPGPRAQSPGVPEPGDIAGIGDDDCAASTRPMLGSCRARRT